MREILENCINRQLEGKGGSNNIDQALAQIKEGLLGKLPKEEECYCGQLDLKVGDTVCSNCIRNNFRIQVKQVIEEMCK